MRDLIDGHQLMFDGVGCIQASAAVRHSDVCKDGGHQHNSGSGDHDDGGCQHGGAGGGNQVYWARCVGRMTTTQAHLMCQQSFYNGPVLWGSYWGNREMFI